MALERSASLLRAEWSRENDWARARLRGDAGAGVRLDTTRGIDLNAGAFARASLDAGVRKFLAASVTGSLQAQATLQAQLQLPINLFREAGVAVRLQARAEAAATIGVALGLSVGDFLDCLDAEFGSDGVAAALGRLVLEESVLEGGALASYSVSVMAYANAAMTVRLLEGASAEPGQQPGFTIFAEAGAGFEVGEGVRYGLQVGFVDVRRMVSRATDIVVDGTIDALRAAVGAQGDSLLDLVGVASRVAFRSAYEIGTTVARQGVPGNEDEGQALCRLALDAVLAETSRYLCESVLSGALQEMRAFLEPVLGDPLSPQDPLRATLAKLAGLLERAPRSAVTASPEALAFWASVVADLVEVVARVSASTATEPSAETRRALTMLWSASQLLSPEKTAVQDARRSLDAPPLIGDYLNQVLGREPGGPVTLEGAGAYLVVEGIEVAATMMPGLRSFLDRLAGSVALNEILPVIVRLPSALADLRDADDRTIVILRAVVSALRGLVLDEFRSQRQALDLLLEGQPVVRAYLDDVLLPSVEHSLNVLSERIADRSGVGTKEELEEQLSIILLGLMGRAMVVTGEVFNTLVLGKVKEGFDALAQQAGSLGLSWPAAIRVPGTTAMEELQASLRMAGEILGPPPEEIRQRTRRALLQLMSPTSAAGSGASTAVFVPPEAAWSLIEDLSAQATWRLERYVELVLDRRARQVGRLIEDAKTAIVAAVKEWMGRLDGEVKELERAIRRLGEEIDRLMGQLAALLKRLEGELAAALESLRTPEGRDVLRAETLAALERQVSATLSLNPLASALPDWFRQEQLPALLRDVASALLDSPLVDEVMGLAGSVSWDVGACLSEVSEVDPAHLPDFLAQRLVELTVGAIDSGVEGLTRALPTRFEVSFQPRDPITGRDIPLLPPVSLSFDLGSVLVPYAEVMPAFARSLVSLPLLRAAVAPLAATVTDTRAKNAEVRAAAHRAAPAEQARLAASQQEQARAAAAPRAARITAPVPLSRHQDTVPIEVRFENVWPSYLGNAATPPRILLTLNGVSLPLDQFEAKEVPRRLRLPQPAPGRTFLSGKAAAADALAQLFTDRPQDRETMILTGNVPAASCAPGLNTLVVAVVDGVTQGAQATVTFLHAGPPAVAPSHPQLFPPRIPWPLQRPGRLRDR